MLLLCGKILEEVVPNKEEEVVAVPPKMLEFSNPDWVLKMLAEVVGLVGVAPKTLLGRFPDSNCPNKFVAWLTSVFWPKVLEEVVGVATCPKIDTVVAAGVPKILELVDVAGEPKIELAVVAT